MTRFYNTLTNTQKMYNMYLSGGYSMKRRDLIKKMENAGFVFDRHGGDHDVYKRGNDKESIPRHKEINESLAKFIIKKWGLK